jgi:phospholipid/cholesterol/gamma-HCH transport system substrate-binding protein
MKAEQLKSILIGFFIIAACSLAIWMLLFLHPSLGDGKQVLLVRFANINQINIGTRVTFAGKPVGQVMAIAEVKDARQIGKVDEMDQIYIFQLTLNIDSRVKVYTTDDITIQTSGLLGEKSIAIMPEMPKPGEHPQLVTNQILYAKSIGQIETVLHQIESLGVKLGNTVSEVLEILQENRENIEGTILGMRNTFQSAGDILLEAKQEQLVSQTSHILNNLGQITEGISQESVKTIVDNMATVTQMLGNSAGDIQETITNARGLTQEGQTAFANLSDITESIKDGRGSIGKLVDSDDFYLRLVSIMSKVDTLMNDVNHYGILFNLNKQWQRTRTKRFEELKSIKDPKEFKNYLNQEVDSITVALARISILLDKAKTSKDKEAIFKSEMFQKDFRYLLEVIGSLDDILKMYNERLQAIKNNS